MHLHVPQNQPIDTFVSIFFYLTTFQKMVYRC